MARTWILTGSPENHGATAALGCPVTGLEEREREATEPNRRPATTGATA